VGPSFNYAGGDDRHARAGGPRTQQSGEPRIWSSPKDVVALGVASRQIVVCGTQAWICDRAFLYFPARIIRGALRGPTGMVTRPAFRTPCQGKGRHFDLARMA